MSTSPGEPGFYFLATQVSGTYCFRSHGQLSQSVAVLSNSRNTDGRKQCNRHPSPPVLSPKPTGESSAENTINHHWITNPTQTTTTPLPTLVTSANMKSFVSK